MILREDPSFEEYLNNPSRRQSNEGQQQQAEEVKNEHMQQVQMEPANILSPLKDLDQQSEQQTIRKSQVDATVIIHNEIQVDAQSHDASRQTVSPKRQSEVIATEQSERDQQQEIYNLEMQEECEESLPQPSVQQHSSDLVNTEEGQQREEEIIEQQQITEETIDPHNISNSHELQTTQYEQEVLDQSEQPDEEQEEIQQEEQIEDQNYFQKPETFYQKKIKEYEEQALKEFGSASLTWGPRLSRLEQEKLKAANDPNMQRSRNNSKSTQRLHIEAWGGEQAASLTSLFSNTKQKMTKLEQEQLALKQLQQNEQSELQNGMTLTKQKTKEHFSAHQDGFMSDAIKKKSKLELAQEQSKKRLFSEISDSNNTETINFENQAKRKKFNEQSHQDSGNNFLSDVVIKKSRIEREKEEAMKRQQQEKEKQLKNINQKGLVMKFDTIQPRSSKSPQQKLVLSSKQQSLHNSSEKNSKSQFNVKYNKQYLQKENKRPNVKDVRAFCGNAVAEVDPKLEQTMIRDE